jgi:hypothetical protein
MRAIWSSPVLERGIAGTRSDLSEGQLHFGRQCRRPFYQIPLSSPVIL